MPRLLLCAGEVSGDHLAAEILVELHRRVPDLQVRGLAGPVLRGAGVAPVVEAPPIGAVGLVESLAVASTARRVLAALDAEVERWQPHAVLTVDSPGLLLRIAGRARARGIPTAHAVSPQVWAWRPGRVHRVAAAVDLLLCLLPMEPPLYEGTGLRAVFTGHPVVDRVAWRGTRGDPEVLALLPGSRRAEVRRLWPVLASAAQLLPVAVEVPVAPTVDRAWLADTDARLVEALSALTAGAALAASGTATLELAAMGVPLAAVYRVHPLTWAVGRLLVTTPWVALPNIVLGREVVPEHLQSLDPVELARVAEGLLGSEGDVQRGQLAEVRALLGPPGAAGRMADEVAALLGGTSWRSLGGSQLARRRP